MDELENVTVPFMYKGACVKSLLNSKSASTALKTFTPAPDTFKPLGCSNTLLTNWKPQNDVSYSSIG